MAIFPLAPDQTTAQMWSNGVRGGMHWITGRGCQTDKFSVWIQFVKCLELAAQQIDCSRYTRSLT